MQTEHWIWQPEGDGVAITGCTDEADSLVIPSTLDGKPVVTVGCAFPSDRFFRAGRTGAHPLRSLTLPTGLQTLRSLHLADCPQLTELRIPSSVTRITRYAMAYSSLVDVAVEDGDRPLTLETGVFQHSPALHTVILPDRTAELPPYLLAGCELEHFAIPHGIRVIGARVFADARIQWLLVPASLERLESEESAADHGSDCEISRMGEEDEEELFLFGGLYPHPVTMTVEAGAPVLPQLQEAGLFSVAVI